MVKDIVIMMIVMCGPPFIEYDGVRPNEMVRGAVDEAVGASVLGQSKKNAAE